MTKSTIISPKLLHKNSADDVLLTNPRKLVTSKFTSTASQDYSNDVIAGLGKLYQSNDQNKNTLQFVPDRGTVTGMPFTTVMDKEEDESIPTVPHQVLAEISKQLPSDVANNLLFDDDTIEAFLKHHKIVRRSTSFTFINRADHYFFYRKPHEHVPGIMLIEAARQAIYYQLYTYSGYDLGDVTVSLSELNAKFYAYGELMHPIEVVVDDLTKGDEHFPREVYYSVSFYQRGSLISQINSLAPVIPLNRFKLARNACLFDTQSFVPLPSTPIVSLITTNDMAQAIVLLQEIDKGSCITNHPNFSESKDIENAHLTIIYNGKRSFSVPISQLSRNGDSIKWNFGEVKYSEMEELKEIIKCGFVSIEAFDQVV